MRKRSQNKNTEPAPFAPGAGAPTLRSPAPARFPVGAPPRCECGVKPQPPTPPHSHPGRVLLPSGVLRQPRFHVGAPPSVRKRSQNKNTEPAPFAPGAGAPTIQSPAPTPVSCRSTAPVRKRSQNKNTEPAPFAPGAGAPTLRSPAPARFPVGAPPTVRKRSQTPTTEPAPFAPGAGAPTVRSPAPAPVSCRYSVKGQAFMCSSLNNCEESKAVSSLMHAHIPVRYFLITAHWACI